MPPGKRHVRTFIRDHDRHAESGQREGATGAEIYVWGKDVPLAKFIGSLRKGDVAEIKWCFLWAEPKSRKHPQPVRGMLKAMAAIEGKEPGIVIEEWGSGRRLRSNRKADREEMVARGIEMLRHSGRSLAGTKGGRPSDKHTKAALDVMREQWFSRKNKNPAERVAAIEQRIGYCPGLTTLWKMFGSPLGDR